MLRIKKLDIFIAKQFGLLFIATFFICQFVLMMQFLWRYVDELIGKGLSMEVLAQFFWYMGLMLMPQAFPLAILLSSLIAFGNLGESSELTAIKAAGISLLQAMRSLITIVIIISCISFYFQEVIGPKSFIAFRQLLISMQQKNPEVEITMDENDSKEMKETKEAIKFHSYVIGNFHFFQIKNKSLKNFFQLLLTF